MYHSGEPFDQTDWTANYVEGGEIVWDNGTSFGSNPAANAIRWATLYNFRFTADAPPVPGTVTLGMFEPGSGPDSMTATLPVPGAAQGGCNAADLAEPFGVLDLGDLQLFIGAFTDGDLLADITGDGILDLGDVQGFIAEFLAGCP
jgi:phosphate/sulfate permease